ncbi:hypothetical protein GSI_07419 [Ganoderma sinense ZZ0214-1]|uniref:Uncharacterized protein n=1 Tax=Ganoderma sinense ZZ0214-1 TaxID=1077348 RepID=A0A2G8S900_9APHY|nr:hypothetical protein GSI_07419 [Ganoderma sinense ZZ0214-1]
MAYRATRRAQAPAALKAHQLLVKFTADEFANIAHALRMLGLSFSARLDAAAAVAVFERNPVPANKTASAYEKGASTRHVVSCLVPAPYCIDYASLSTLEGRVRLLAAMRQRQTRHYAWWLADPCLPHVFAVLAPCIAPTAAHLKPEHSATEARGRGLST